MRKLLLPLIVCLVLLSGCGENPELKVLKFAESVASAETIGFTAELRADYGDKIAELELEFSKAAEEAVVEIKKPELIAGIRARVSPDGTSLEYEGAILDIGRLPDSELSPVSALPLLLDAIKDGYIEAAWTEDGCIMASLIPSDGIKVSLKLSEELVPLSAELESNGKTQVFITVKDWKLA